MGWDYLDDDWWHAYYHFYYDEEDEGADFSFDKYKITTNNPGVLLLFLTFGFCALSFLACIFVFPGSPMHPFYKRQRETLRRFVDKQKERGLSSRRPKEQECARDGFNYTDGHTFDLDTPTTREASPISSLVIKKVRSSDIKRPVSPASSVSSKKNKRRRKKSQVSEEDERVVGEALGE